MSDQKGKKALCVVNRSPGGNQVWIGRYLQEEAQVAIDDVVFEYMLFAQQLVSDATKRMLELIKHHQPEKVFVMIPKKGGAEEADFARQLVCEKRKRRKTSKAMPLTTLVEK